VKATVWGARGSVPAPGPETTRYGGNTSCVHVALDDGSELVLDAGTGIRCLGLAMTAETERIHISSPTSTWTTSRA
jgi:phosphoribosyl 1,2-cyclic phosphodiesterase